MVIEYNNNKPTQSNLESLNQHSIISWKLKQMFCVESYVSSDMHYFVLILEITTIQMCFFLQFWTRNMNKRKRKEEFKTSNISCDLFFSVLIQSCFFDEKQIK